ncbi:MAG: DNA polymerase III subunit delta [Christensenellales bacterium]
MNRETFHEQLKTGEILRCYLFEGEEEYTKRAALQSLQGRVLKGDFAALNHSVLRDPPVDELIAVGETLPLLADRRLVVVKDFSLLAGKSAAQDAEEDAGKPGKDAGADRISAWLNKLPGSLCLVFYVGGKANATRRLYKQIAKQGGVVTFDTPDQNTLIKWMARELKAFGKQIDRATAEQMLFAVGDDMNRLSNELAKVAACAGERNEIQLADIDAVCIKTTEYKVFDLADAVVAGKADRASRLMRDMLREGEERLMLLALLQRQYRQLLFARILMAGGTPPDSLARTLGVPPFIARKLQTVAGQYTVGRLKWAYDLLIDTEFAVKSGQISEEGSLEQALYRLLGEQRKGASHA